MANQNTTNNVARPNGDDERKRAVKIVFGAMTFGKQGAEAARIFDLEVSGAVLDVLKKHGHNEVDTARVYSASEQLLGQLQWQSRDIVMGTKLNPRRFGPISYSHKKEDLKRGISDNLEALRADKIDLWYLHTPGHNTPYEETLEAVNELYKAGLFTRFGISNYAAWEVARICELCNQNNWKRPDVYQGCYHVLQRSIEPELIPCLRHYGIHILRLQSFGWWSSKQTSTNVIPLNMRRVADLIHLGCRERVSAVDTYFAALDVVRPVAKRLGLTTTEAALRWLSHHSKLKQEHGDAIIVGASSAAQLDNNLADLEKGPSPEELATVMDKAWGTVKGIAGSYHM